MGRAALELIGQSGLGLNFFKTVLEQEYILPIAVKIGTPGFRRWILDLIPYKTYRDLCGIVDTWDRTATEIFEEKKKALAEGDEALAKQVGQAKDLISILMKENMKAADEDKLSDEEVLGQRLRAEIDEATKKHGEDINYDDLVALPFLDAVCRETLRLHPPVTKTLRVSREDAALPLSTPIKGVDGREIDSILVPKGAKILVSILNANTDPLLWGSDSLD
ncbi:hypothetical protein H0H87_010722 [Tephrocybe sp. NHM501043]|nr:hypothetical protein H0H87_010722 [Tephrocybe sp. NHM501043]